MECVVSVFFGKVRTAVLNQCDALWLRSSATQWEAAVGHADELRHENSDARPCGRARHAAAQDIGKRELNRAPSWQRQHEKTKQKIRFHQTPRTSDRLVRGGGITSHAA